MKIDDNDFKLIKEHLPKFTNILKPTKKTILSFYIDMMTAIDNYEMGRIDQHHPKIIEAYRRKKKRMYRAWQYALGSFIAGSPYGGYR